MILHLLCILTGEAFRGNFCKARKSPDSYSFFLFSENLATVFALLISRAFIDSLAINYFFLKGIPNSLRRDIASLSVLAEVTKEISIPEILLTLSISISGKIICSLIPRL